MCNLKSPFRFEGGDNTKFCLEKFKVQGSKLIVGADMNFS
jgi:hypothetical protein